MKEVIPFGIIEVGGNDCRCMTIPLAHEFEEGIDLL